MKIVCISPMLLLGPDDGMASSRCLCFSSDDHNGEHGQGAVRMGQETKDCHRCCRSATLLVNVLL